MRITTIVAGLVVLLAACGSDTVSRSLGARCEATRDCDDRCLPPSNDWPDGLCTLDCTDVRDCPGGAECIDKEGGVCLFECAADRDCAFLGPSWVCREENLREDQNRKAFVCRGG